MNGFIREIKKEGSLWCSLMFLQAKFKHYNRKTYRWRRGKMLNLLLCSNGITALKILQCLLKRNEKLARYFEICGWGDPLAPIIELIPPLPKKKTAICKVVMIRNLQRCPRNNYVGSMSVVAILMSWLNLMSLFYAMCEEKRSVENLCIFLG